MNIIAEALGYIGGTCIAFSFLPQTLRILKSRDVKGLSLPTYIIYCIGIASWILYGIYLKSVQVILFNAISLFFAGAILTLIILNKKNKKTK